ncbi:MAG: DUF3276 family protein [Bacteroidota bacterium]
MIEEGIEKIDELVSEQPREEIYSKAVRAGKRTYFFDVKATRKNDYYLTITESKKRFNKDGKFFYEKHKIFLYKEDFEKFSDGLAEIIDYIREANPVPIELENEHMEHDEEHDYTSVEFEDLEENN